MKLSVLTVSALIISSSFICVSGKSDQSDPSWKCPTDAGTTCQCDDVTSFIHCNGATYKEIETFFYELKFSNPDGVHVDLFRIENYKNESLEVSIFTSCLIPSYSCRTVEMSFGTMDFRGNKHLKYIGTSLNTNNDKDRISVQNLLLNNCSLSGDEKSVIYNFLFRGLKMFGSKLEHVDFSQNHLTEVKAKSGFDAGFDWPNLKIFNVSNNKITDIGNGWFQQTPNVDVIDLSSNYIQNIWNEAFGMNDPHPDKIDKEIIIDLTNNRLNQFSQLYGTIFTNLKRPTKVILHENDFNYLPQQPFQGFLNKRGDSIDISNNQLICDCKSEWLRSMALIYDKRVVNYNCLNFNSTSVFKIGKNLCYNC